MWKPSSSSSSGLPSWRRRRKLPGRGGQRPSIVTCRSFVTCLTGRSTMSCWSGRRWPGSGQLLEDNSRHRRLSVDEEKRLLAEAPVHLRPLIIFASDTGLRRGEMLGLRWDDLEARPGWIRVRGETAKSRRTRWVPIGTGRLRQVLDFLRSDASGQRKPSDAAVFSNEVGEPIRYFQTAWRATLRRAGIEDLH